MVVDKPNADDADNFSPLFAEPEAADDANTQLE
jgi:hypothetical protein